MANPFHTLRTLYRSASYVNRLVRDPITSAAATRVLREGLTQRVPAFLEMLGRAVFAQPASPYRPLLDHAGYGFDRIRALAHERGIEGTLAQLAAAGVYVAIEEYKGRREVRRGSLTLRFPEHAFDNPLTRGGLEASSGGTRSPGLWTTISLGNHRLGAHHLALALASYGLERAPISVWLPYAHGASQWAVLALAATRNRAPRWFTQLPIGAAGYRMYLRALAIRLAALGNGLRLPAATHVPVGAESIILDWIGGERGRPLGIFTTPSSALRLALAARRSTRRLDGVSFITIGEPLTPTKLRAVQELGGRAFSSLGFTEYGRVTYGCARASGGDDGHVLTDGVAVIEHRRPVDRFGTEVDAMLFTALRPDSRKILLNMETGDYAALAERRCGCLLGGLGLTLHMQDIRSFEKLNAEGRLFFGCELITLLEELLPSRFGGDPTDYQVVEEEDGLGFTRLVVLAHPRLGAIDERAVLACVDEQLAALHRVNQQVWNETGTLQIRRAAPIVTRAGKVMALHHLSVARPVAVAPARAAVA